MNDKRQRDEAGNLIDLRDRKNEELERQVNRLWDALAERDERIEEMEQRETAQRETVENVAEAIEEALSEMRDRIDQLERVLIKMRCAWGAGQ